MEMAHRSGVPILVLVPKDKKVSRLLRGNPAITRELEYESYDHALTLLRNALPGTLRPMPHIPNLLP